MLFCWNRSHKADTVAGVSNRRMRVPPTLSNDRWGEIPLVGRIISINSCVVVRWWLFENVAGVEEIGGYCVDGIS